MDGAADFKEHLRRTSDRIMQALDAPEGEHGTPVERTAWDLKLELKIPQSLLYLALGSLLREHRVELLSRELTYVVRKNVSASVPSQV